jgi:hypothetical protein
MHEDCLVVEHCEDRPPDGLEHKEGTRIAALWEDICLMDYGPLVGKSIREGSINDQVSDKSVLVSVSVGERVTYDDGECDRAEAEIVTMYPDCVVLKVCENDGKPPSCQSGDRLVALWEHVHLTKHGPKVGSALWEGPLPKSPVEASSQQEDAA